MYSFIYIKEGAKMNSASMLTDGSFIIENNTVIRDSTYPEFARFHRHISGGASFVSYGHNYFVVKDAYVINEELDVPPETYKKLMEMEENMEEKAVKKILNDVSEQANKKLKEKGVLSSNELLSMAWGALNKKGE